MSEESQIKNDPGNLKWWVLATVMVGTFLGRIDQTIVNLALPKIIGDFGITVSAAGWIATAYILANAVFVPVWGKLGDTLGRKKIYIIGFVVFIIGSILAGLSWNLSSMIVFRIIQAIAGSADYPTAMAIIAITFKEGKQRAQALGIWSASFAAATVFGPLLGGPLIDNFGWRSVFLVNLPIGLIGLLMAIVFVDESTSKVEDESFDWLGALSLGVFLSAIVLVLDQGMDWGWISSGSILCYLTSILSFVFFYHWERAQRSPIIDFKFFKNEMFVGALVNNFVSFMGMMGSVFLIPVFAQSFLGYNATESGYLFMPMAFMMVFASPIGGSFTGKVAPQYIIFISSLIAAFGLFLFTGLDPRSGALDIIIPLCVMAFGLGLGMAQRTSIVASAVPHNEIGIASSILALVRNISGAFGIAIFATILKNLTESNVVNISKLSTFHFQTSADVSKAIGLITFKADIVAYEQVFLIASLVMLVGAFTSFMIKAGKEIPKEEVFIE
ncbi:MAG: MDR family MFS transporter [bacterium]